MMHTVKYHNQCSQIAIIRQTTTKIKNTVNTITLNIDHFYHCLSQFFKYTM